ncbi:uncharacterized protein [Littorina saxatilis]|uniref:uncharacterized protein isoform X2 n=1 Tax=Littorina saxatilis TaxID=31220 RepID=UPI0038B66B0D
MTTMTATLRMLLLICISLGQIRLVRMQIPNVTVDGVYLIAMVADPYIRTEMFLQFNRSDAGFAAYGRGDAAAGLVVAVYLKAGTIVTCIYTGNPKRASGVSVGFASYVKNYLTLRSSGQSSGPPNVVKFDYRFLDTGVWSRNDDNADYMKITTCGIYWVAARPDCGNGAVSLNVGTGLFNVFCDGGKALSASGAFYLQAGRKLKVTFKSGRSLGNGTSFSFVYLEGNEQKYIKHTDHLAFTAWTDHVGVQSKNATLSFNKKKTTDYGSLYNSARRTWTIPTTGNYIVSMRGDPDGTNTLKVTCYKNNNTYVSTWYNEHGTKSGQTGIFQFTKDDTLWMANDLGSYVGEETFMSITLMWVAPE